MIKEHTYPLLAKFETVDGKYIYDANSGVIARVNGDLYDCVEESTPWMRPPRTATDCRNSKGDVDLRLATVSEELGIFRGAKLHCGEICPESIMQCRDKVIGAFSRFCLEVTSRCNLRCGYCPFTEGAAAMREHGCSDMSWDTAERAISYFARNLAVRGQQPHNLGFYGGEPLLAFGLIRRCVEFALENIPDVEFSCTTNGTLLSNDIADFLVARNFSLLVSLDGPSAVHDRNRPTVTGSPSFELTWQNILRLQERYPQYYRTRVRFEATVATEGDFTAVFKFFLSRPDVFDPGQVSIAPANQIGRRAGRISDVGQVGVNYVVERFEEKLLSGNRDASDREWRLLRSFLERPYLVLSKRAVCLDGIEARFRMGSCSPGFERLFTSVDGKYHLCEKIGRNVPIGDVVRGVAPDAIIYLYERYWQHLNEACCSCWAFGLCGLCYLRLARQEPRDVAIVDYAECKLTLDSWRRTLSRFCYLLERNPDIFDYLKDVQMSTTSRPDVKMICKAIK